MTLITWIRGTLGLLSGLLLAVLVPAAPVVETLALGGANHCEPILTAR